jgi:hypothetical protein
MATIPKSSGSKIAAPRKQIARPRKPVGGDETHSLPREKREPYRLWFEFLKTALKDPTVSVDRKFYAEWGNVEDTAFNPWWDKHWRDLFAEPIKTVAVLHSREEFDGSLADPNYLVVKIPVSTRARPRNKELQSAIEDELRSSPRPPPKSRFVIAAKRSMKLDLLRAMLKLYQFSLKNDRNPEAAAIAYCDWAKRWNDSQRAQKVFVEPFLLEFVEATEALKSATNAHAKKEKRRNTEYDEKRGQVRRYIRQAERIAKNVGRGDFPGKFG